MIKLNFFHIAFLISMVTLALARLQGREKMEQARPAVPVTHHREDDELPEYQQALGEDLIKPNEEEDKDAEVLPEDAFFNLQMNLVEDKENEDTGVLPGDTFFDPQMDLVEDNKNGEEDKDTEVLPGYTFFKPQIDFVEDDKDEAETSSCTWYYPCYCYYSNGNKYRYCKKCCGGGSAYQSCSQQWYGWC